MNLRRTLRSCLAIALLTTAMVASSTAPAGAVGWLADYVYGQGGSYTTKAGGVTATDLSNPMGTTIDNVHHRLFVVDQWNHRVQVYNLDASNNPTDSTADYTIGGGGTGQSDLNNPAGAVYDSVNDRLFVADTVNSRVLVFNTSTITNGMNASYVLGQPDFTSTSPLSTQNGMGMPYGLAYDSVNTRLFVTDPTNNRVLAFNVSSITNGMNASYVLGQANFTANGWGGGQAGFGGTGGADFDPVSQYLYVTDVGNNRVLVFNTAGIANGMNASYVVGQPDFTTYGGSTTQSTFIGPTAVDAKSPVIYVTDTANNRILGFTKANLADGMNASHVIGQPNYTSTTGSTTQMTVDFPHGIAVDVTTGKLYLADTTNNRVLAFNLQAVNTNSISTVVDPSMTFTVAGRASVCNGQSSTNFQTNATTTAVSLGHLSSATVGGGAQDLSVATNAANGFNVYLRTGGTTPHSLRDGNSHSIADVSGTNASPGAAPVAGTAGFGYTSSDASTPFTPNTWAKLTNTNEAVMIGSAGTTSKSACIGFEVAVASTTPAGMYSSNVIYVAVPTF